MSEVLRILSSPPWRRAAKEIAAPKKSATFAERIEWSDEVPRPGIPKPPRRTLDKKRLAELEAGTAKFAFDLLSELADADALAFFLRTPVERWQPAWLGRHLRIQLARFGLRAVDAILRFAKKSPVDVALALEPVVSPRVAPLMADLLSKGRETRAYAERWLLRNAEAAAVGLAGGSKNAQHALRFMIQNGQGGVVALATGVVVSDDPIENGVPPKVARLPEFLALEALPAVKLQSGKRLGRDELTHLLEMLSFCDLEKPYAGVEAVRSACDRESLGELAWDLLETWHAHGGPAEQKWMFASLAHFGGDRHARAIANLARTWTTDHYWRSVLALDILAAMDSEVSLAELHGLTLEAKSAPFKKRARTKLETVAKKKGFTADDLADRVVPTLGLTLEGTRDLVVEGRTYVVGFDSYLTPSIRGVKSLKSVAWTALKKEARSIGKRELERFETAMVTQRRWSAASFSDRIVQHPLLGHLAKRLVFGVYSVRAGLVGTFRIDDDRTLSDIDERRVRIGNAALVGVLHPLETTTETLSRWGTIFSDYEIIQPFEQLGRGVRSVTRSELAKLEEVESLRLLGLERRAWTRDVSDGYVVGFEREAGNQRASLRLEQPLAVFDPQKGSTAVHLEVSKDAGAIFLAEVGYDLRLVGALSTA